MALRRRVGAAVRAFLNPTFPRTRAILPPEPTRVVVDQLLEGRNALITGAGRNIGKSIALEFLAHGANVYCTEVEPARCETLQVELDRLGGRSRVFRADITKSEDTDRVLESLRESKVDIDLLVNNVGIVVDDFSTSFQTNVVGPVYLTDRVSQEMIQRHVAGSIIFLTSIHQDAVFTRTKGYAASKAAVGMVIKQLAVQLAPHRIRVNGIAPGDVREDEKGNVVPYVFTPLEGTSIKPQYIARAAVYLASEYFSHYTTGSIIKIDGGLSLFNYQCAADASLYL
jgi:NAD(P)-dependent dehydrogenase (short-subunit alcohol dehydrogenase family)